MPGLFLTLVRLKLKSEKLTSLKKQMMGIFFNRYLLQFSARSAPAQFFFEQARFKNLSICTEEPRLGSFKQNLPGNSDWERRLRTRNNDKIIFDEIFYL